MGNDPFHAEVARAALMAAATYGFAVGGAQALVAYGVIVRPTEDIDLFTDRDDGVGSAQDAVRMALVAAGFDVTPLAEQQDLAEMFEGFDLGMAE